jgi:hypothetical protein
MWHTKFHGPTTFLLGCRGVQIGESISTIKGQTNDLRQNKRKPCKISKQFYFVRIKNKLQLYKEKSTIQFD